MKRALNIAKKISAALLIVALIFFVSAVAFARTEYAQNLLLEKVSTLLREDYGLEASLGEAELELIPLRGHVLNVEILEDVESGDPFLVVQRLTLGLQVAALLQGRVEIAEITLEEPQLHLVVEGQAITNLPRLRTEQGRESDDGSGPTRLVHDLGVVAGVIELELKGTPVGDVMVDLEDVNLDVSFDEEGNPEIRLLITSGAVTQGEQRHEIEVIQGRVAIRDEQAILRYTRISLGDLRLSIPRGTVGLTAPFDVQAGGELTLPLESVGTLPVSAPPLQGATSLSFEVTRAAGRLEAQGNLQIGGLVIGPYFVAEDKTMGPHAVGDITTDFQYRPEELSISELVIDRPADGDGRLIARNLALTLSDEAIPIRADVEFQGTELAQILIDAGLYTSRVKLKVFGDTSMEGHLAQGFQVRFPDVDFRVRDFQVLTQNTYKEDAERVIAVAAGTVRGGLVLIDGEGVTLRSIAVAAGGTRLGVSGHLGFNAPKRFTLDIATPENGTFRFSDIGGDIAGLPFEGQGPLTCSIDGPYADPMIRGSVDLQDFVLGDISFGHVRGAVTYRNLVLGLPNISGDRGESSFQFTDGRVDFRHGVSVNGLVEVAPLSIADGVEMFGLEDQAGELVGSATGQAQLSMRHNRWRAEVRTDLAGLAFGEYEIGDGETTLVWDNGDIDIEHFVTKRSGGGEAIATGHIGRAGSLDLDIEVSGIPIQDLEQVAAPLAELNGTMRGKAKVLGTLEYPRSMGWIDISPVVYREASHFGPSRIRFELDGQDLQVSGDLGGRIAQLDELRLTLQSPYPLWIRGAFQNVELSALLSPETLPEGLGVLVDARIDAGVDVERLIDRPERRRGRVNRHDYGLSGWVSIDSLTINHSSFIVNNTDPIRFDLQRDRAAIERSSFTFNSTELNRVTDFDLGGWISPEGLGLELRGQQLDLGFVPDMVESVEDLEGTLDVNCQVGGTYEQPSLIGEAAIRIGRLKLSGLDYVAERLVGSLRFSHNVVLIDNLRAQVLGGDARGSGRVTLDGLSLDSYRLDASVRDARLSLGPRSSAVVNGNIALTSPTRGEELPLIGGQIEVVRLRYTEPIELLAFDLDQISRRISQRRDRARTYDPEGDSIRLDLRLVAGNNLRVENNLAQTDLLLDDSVHPFRLVGTNQIQNVLGTVLIDPRGSLTFRNTEFDIERGVLEFSDPFEFNPSIDLLATAVRRDWTITLRVFGSFQDPTVTLSSDPPLTESDIALLLTVGLTQEETEQLGYGSSATSALPELLWSLTGVDDEVSRLVPILDELTITTEYSSRTGRAEPRVRVGRRLTERVRVGASAGLAGERDVEANVEVKISENLSVAADYANDEDSTWGNIGGDLRWRLEF